MIWFYLHVYTLHTSTSHLACCVCWRKHFHGDINGVLIMPLTINSIRVMTNQLSWFKRCCLKEENVWSGREMVSKQHIVWKIQLPMSKAHSILMNYYLHLTVHFEFRNYFLIESLTDNFWYFLVLDLKVLRCPDLTQNICQEDFCVDPYLTQFYPVIILIIITYQSNAVYIKRVLCNVEPTWRYLQTSLGGVRDHDGEGCLRERQGRKTSAEQTPR